MNMMLIEFWHYADTFLVQLYQTRVSHFLVIIYTVSCLFNCLMFMIGKIFSSSASFKNKAGVLHVK